MFLRMQLIVSLCGAILQQHGLIAYKIAFALLINDQALFRIASTRKRSASVVDGTPVVTTE